MKIFNPLSGKNAPGNRFCFSVRSIGHRSLHLPIAMRKYSKITQLMDGVSPLEVFSCESIDEARRAFYQFRMMFDFPYWAAVNFKIRDISSGRIIPLVLNDYQRWLTETLVDYRYYNPSGKYLISKDIPRCGLTTLIQAFIIWNQQCIRNRNSITYASSFDMKQNLMDNACRAGIMKRGSDGVSIKKPDTFALFHQVDSPGVLDNVSYDYIHISDMSHWYDPSGYNTNGIISSVLNGWNHTPCSMMVLEGDRVRRPNAHYCYNAYFVKEIEEAGSPYSDFLHIALPQCVPTLVSRPTSNAQRLCQDKVSPRKRNVNFVPGNTSDAL